MAQIKTKEFDVDSLRIASPCHVGWDAMQGDERVRHCDSCRLNVFNVAAMTVNEFEQLVMEREGRLCIRMYRRTDGTVITRDCPVGLRAYQKRVARIAGTALTAILGLFSISFAQKDDGKAIDVSKLKIVRTISNNLESELRGLVLDPQGEVVAGARVTLRTKGAERTITSDVDGKYSFSNLPEGRIAFTVQVPGFEKYEVKNLTVEKSERLDLDIVLKIDHRVEIIGIFVGDEPMIDTTSPTVKTTITNRQIRNLPY